MLTINPYNNNIYKINPVNFKGSYTPDPDIVFLSPQDTRDIFERTNERILRQNYAEDRKFSALIRNMVQGIKEAITGDPNKDTNIVKQKIDGLNIDA